MGNLSIGRLDKGTIKLLHILLVLILLMFALGYLASSRHWKSESRRHEDNYNILSKDASNAIDGISNTLKLTREQFESEKGGYIDSINKLNDERIKLKRVLHFTQFELKKYRENVPVNATDSFLYYLRDTIFLGRIAKMQDSCLSVKVFIPDTGNVVYFTPSLTLKGSLIIYEGKRRKQLHIGKLNLFRVGGRLTTAKMNTNCDSAEISIQDIEIIKN